MKKFMIASGAALCACSMATAQEAAVAEEAESVDLSEAAANILGNLTLETTVEVTGSYFKQGDDKDFDINLDTVEFDLFGDITDSLHFFGALLYEEGEEDNHVTIDQAYLTLDLEAVEGLSLVAGKLTMPFGVYETGLISDPLTLQLGEITDAAVGLVYESDYIDAAAFVFGGDIEDDADEPSWLASVTLKPAEEFSVWAGVLSDIAEAALDDDINDALEEAESDDYDAALGVNVGAKLAIDEDFTLSAEYVAAVDDIEIAGEKIGQPQAWAVDVIVAVADDLALAARYEGSKEWADMPETQFGVGAEYAINENLALAVEYLYGQYDEEWSENDDDSHTVSLKLALTF